ncbi:MAG: dockerin type I domain-containing protein [Chloroflexota bacterium]
MQAITQTIKTLISTILVTVLLLTSTPLSLMAQPLMGQSGGVAIRPTSTSPSELLFRTRVTIRTGAQWRTLERLGVEVLERGPESARLLVDDQQLADLARLRFNPTETNTVETLAAADQALAASIQPLLQKLRTVQAARQDIAQQRSALRTSIRASIQALTATQRRALTTTPAVDGDNDGLTDDQEMYWCTDPARADSDFDGRSDGEEVAILKAWLNNELAIPPLDTAQPFNGWPFDNQNCLDNDKDAVPNLAERWELGLNMNVESTDRDRYDDGQELYGVTYCPGSGSACGYGQLPSANHDGILLFPQMPAWVNAPGNHPLVAAFPKVEVDLLADNNGHTFKLQLATTVTTDERHEQGETKLYQTTKTEGTSTANAETETWDTWQETSRTDQAVAAGHDGTRAQRRQSMVINSTNIQANTSIRNSIRNEYKVTVNNGEKKSFAGEYLRNRGGSLIDFALNEGCDEVGCRKYVSAGLRAATRTLWNIPDIVQNSVNSNACGDSLWNKVSCAGKAIGSSFMTTYGDRLEVATMAEEEAINQASGNHVLQDGNHMSISPMYPISFPPPAFVPTITQTQGSSRGGARTTTHTRYEEHAVTEGTSKQIGKSWGTATAQNSAHAADLWFAYSIQNIGTDYARTICDLAFGIYIGNGDLPAITYYPAADFGGDGCLSNFRPGEANVYTFPSQSRIALTLEHVKAIDLGEPVRIVVTDVSLGQDDYYTDDALSASVSVMLEDGTDDGNEAIDTYLIPTWGQETVLDVLMRYFPYETDDNDSIIAIWTPEQGYDQNNTPSWCQEPLRPSDFPSKGLWCKHTLSTADWWNVYTDGLGDGSEGFQNSAAVPESTVLFRFNKDSDLDGFSDRSEARLGTDANDASSFPKPEVLAGLHQIRTGNNVVATLSLLNRGFYDAYGMEAVMVAPDDSITINNNTVGGSGRVRALNQVIVGSRIAMRSPIPENWTSNQNGHAVPAVSGYYTGGQDRNYTFTVSGCGSDGCSVGGGDWTLNWNDGVGNSGSLSFGDGYQSPTFLPLGNFGVTLALYSGSVSNGENFVVEARTPRDTFQYTINSEPYTQPLVIVSYNDPQGNHRFVLPPDAMSLSAPTDDLSPFAGMMLGDVGVELVTDTFFEAGENALNLLVNNPTGATLTDAHLFLEFINTAGDVVAEVPTNVTLPSGPTYTPVTVNTASFSPAYDEESDYIVLAFLTDHQGNILDTAGRPLSSFQADPSPKLAVDDSTLTWNVGTLPQGTLATYPLSLANAGYGRLYTYLSPATGFSLATGNRTIGAAGVGDYELLLNTVDLPVGALEQTLTLKSSDPDTPSRELRVVGTITEAAPDLAASGMLRPLDVTVTITGSRSAGEWVTFEHELRPEPESLHPVKVYDSEYGLLKGVGVYATEFNQGTASAEMFGDGRDGVMPTSGNLDNNNGFGHGYVNGSAGSTSIAVTDRYSVWRIQPGDAILIHQTQGSGAGQWELNNAVSAFTGNGTFTLEHPLQNTYSTSGNNRAQIVRVPQYTTCNVTGTMTPLRGWNGYDGGIFVVMCQDTMTITGRIHANGYGYRGVSHGAIYRNQTGYQGEGYARYGTKSISANGNGGGGGHGTKDSGAGGGGGHGSKGGNGPGSHDTNPRPGGTGGNIVGDPTLSTIYFGGAGGEGGADEDGGNPGSGGHGGGIIVIFAETIQQSGTIESNGIRGGDRCQTCGGGSGIGMAGGGGGAGGSILLVGEQVDINSTTRAAGGGGGTTYLGRRGGDGGVGRIRIEYCDEVSGSTNPAASTQKLNCYITEQVTTEPYNQTRLNLPDTFNEGMTYRVQFGHKLDFTEAGDQTISLRVPAGMVNTAKLDALVSGISADAILSLDIGNDDSIEWSGTVTNTSTNTRTDLADAFTDYWRSQGSPTSGTLDVPVKVTLNRAGQVLLTNLQMQTTGSRLRYVEVDAQSYSTFNLDFLMGGTGSVALDIGDDGSIDWSADAQSTRQLTGNLATALNSYLAGKSGVVTVPMRFYVPGDQTVTLNNFDATVNRTYALSSRDLRVSSSQTGDIEEGDIVPLQATIQNDSNSDSGLLTAAFFAHAPGWGDWYIGSDVVENLPANGSAQVNVNWNTTGFAQDAGADALSNVQVKVVVNPYRHLNESNYGNNTATHTVAVKSIPDTTDPGDFTPGDINGDGAVNIFDLQVLINMILHDTPNDTALYPADQWARGELSGDGAWNIFDLQQLINLITQ